MWRRGWECVCRRRRRGVGCGCGWIGLVSDSGSTCSSRRCLLLPSPKPSSFYVHPPAALFSSIAHRHLHHPPEAPLPDGGEHGGGDDGGFTTPGIQVADKLASLLQEQQQEPLEPSLDVALAGVDQLEESLLLDLLHRRSPSPSPLRFLALLNWALSRNKLLPGVSLTSRLLDALPLSLLRHPTAASPLWALTKHLALHFHVLPSSTATFNRFISSFSHLGRPDDLLDVFSKISELGSVPDPDSYYLAIVGLCKASSFDSAASLSQRMLDLAALPDDPAKLGHIVRLFCKAGKSTHALSVYARAKHLPFSDLCRLIASLSRNDETVALAADMLGGLSGKDRQMAIKPFSLVVRGFCRMNDVGAAKALLSRMIAEGPPPGNDVFNRVIAAYSRNGDLEAAVETMKLMETRGLKPDVYTYTVIMSGYSRGGLMEEAGEILSLAKQRHSKLTPVTYHTLIRGYCKLQQFDKALGLLAEMDEFGVRPNADEYNKLVQSLCLKALDWKAAEKLLKEMEERGLFLNGNTRGLITAVKELEESGY